MSSEIDYEQFEPFQFGGVLPSPKTFAESAALILPLPFDRTTSYMPGSNFAKLSASRKSGCGPGSSRIAW